MVEVEAVRGGIETDSKMLVEMLNGLLLPEASIEGLLWDIEHSKWQLAYVEFLHTSRLCNMVAHLVAKYIVLSQSGYLIP
ncbi:hypothetical protein D8674_028763 [Pyrus ussuriensis x Pyrus communis]|uniref:RNase H type-1 domain-containing protein n=1 Tax=Pyrus ussuriensis x Pyrus communis TaxID=2448454 RepID=A0A5N5HX92_9ROSA|nr:hypothetical protein D8674_028763 [Pyrus ussuriensis x Pyrus communis]